MIGTLELIRHMEVSGEQGVFTLGSLEDRVTLYSQQVRALNLIHALFEQRQLRENSRLAVVGGGAAGLTAAAGAAFRGCKVTVLEQMSTLLPLWRQNRSRWLHPHIYDWPLSGSEKDEARLPVLNWKAAVAREVAEQLLTAWELVKSRHSIQVHTGAADIKIQPRSGTERAVTWNTRRFHRERFDVIILAVGFGLEKRQEGVFSPFYWDEDNFDHTQKHPDKPRKDFLISGTGDGGLVELFRVRLGDFRHERFVKELLSDPLLQETKERLLQLEDQFLGRLLTEGDLFERYEDLPVPPTLDQQLEQRLRTDTMAVLNGLSESALSTRSCILNRFLASRLIRLGVTYEQGPFSAKRLNTGNYEVIFQSSGKLRHFDEVIIRHGAESALARFFKRNWKDEATWTKEEARLRDFAKLDQTRTPLWRDEDFLRNPLAVDTGVSAPTAGNSAVDSLGPALQATTPAAANTVGTVLFDIYEPHCEPYYLARKADQHIISALEHMGAWVYGPAGMGKTSAILRALHQRKQEFLYISFANCFEKTAYQLLLHAYFEIIAVLAPQNSQPRPGDTAETITAISTLLAAAPHYQYLYIDELPTEDPTVHGEFTRAFSGLVLKHAKRVQKSQLRYVVSSIHSAIGHVGGTQRQLFERVRPVQFEPWTSNELSQLATIAIKNIPLSLPDQDIQLILQSSHGSPRFIKNCLRKLTSSPSIHWPLDRVIAETSREVL